MNDDVYKELREASWRRALNADEEAQLRAHLVAHPEAQEQWEDEMFLNQQLDRLPDAPLASNFTAQVLQKLDLELAREEREARARAERGWWRRWVPRFASAALVLVLGAIAGVRYHLEHQRALLVDGALKVAPLASVPAPAIFKDFDVIRHLRYVPAAVSDDELLAALQ